MFYRTISIDGLSLSYREAGPKDVPVLLLLHGLPSSSRMFEPLLARLSDRFHLVAPGYPGFGHPRPDADETFARDCKATTPFPPPNCQIGVQLFSSPGAPIETCNAASFASLLTSSQKSLRSPRFVGNSPFGLEGIERRVFPAK
jgi:pimeloyl-ACP methyl ester carboxylesterase